jgi:hypothetical protein
LATKPSLKAFTIGLAPAIEASNPMLPRYFSTQFKISFPYSASNALLAVTTFLLLLKLL